MNPNQKQAKLSYQVNNFNKAYKMTNSPVFDRLEVVNHPVIEVKLAKLRDKNTPPHDFRRILFELAGLMSAAVFGHIKTVPIEIETPLEQQQRPPCRHMFRVLYLSCVRVMAWQMR